MTWLHSSCCKIKSKLSEQGPDCVDACLVTLSTFLGSGSQNNNSCSNHSCSNASNLKTVHSDARLSSFELELESSQSFSIYNPFIVSSGHAEKTLSSCRLARI